MLLPLVGHINEKGMLLLIPLLDLLVQVRQLTPNLLPSCSKVKDIASKRKALVQCYPSDAPPLLEPVLQALFTGVVSGQETGLVVSGAYSPTLCMIVHSLHDAQLSCTAAQDCKTNLDAGSLTTIGLAMLLFTLLQRVYTYTFKGTAWVLPYNNT